MCGNKDEECEAREQDGDGEREKEQEDGHADAGDVVTPADAEKMAFVVLLVRGQTSSQLQSHALKKLWKTSLTLLIGQKILPAR